jgi:hypothetical protein
LIIIHLLFYKILIIKLVTLTPSPALHPKGGGGGEAAKPGSNIFTFLSGACIIFNHELYGPASVVFSLSFPVLPAFPSSNLITRDKKGRFRTPNQEERLPLIALSKKVMDPLIGNLLGDGSLQINKKGQDGKPKLNCNAIYTMTLKDKTYTYYL